LLAVALRFYSNEFAGQALYLELRPYPIRLPQRKLTASGCNANHWANQINHQHTLTSAGIELVSRNTSPIQDCGKPHRSSNVLNELRRCDRSGWN
jgi:hypothetical protein